MKQYRCFSGQTRVLAWKNVLHNNKSVSVYVIQGATFLLRNNIHRKRTIEPRVWAYCPKSGGMYLVKTVKLK